MENLIDDDLEKIESDDSDSDSNDETESNDEQFFKMLKKYFNSKKSLIVCVKASLFFYLRQSV